MPKVPDGDYVPAMLNGDFVIGPESARRFYAQLKAINEGSGVYTDPKITVTVSGADPRETARKIVAELKRHRRRK